MTALPLPGLAAAALAAALAWALPLPAAAQALVAPDWQADSVGPDTGSTFGAGVALDGAHNAYFLSTAPSSLLLQRHAPGGALQWSRTLAAGGPAANGMVVADAAGNALVLGPTVAKFGADGTLLWSQPVPGASTGATTWSGVTDAGGDVYTVGSSATGALVVTRRAAATGQATWTSTLATPGGYNAVIRLAGGRLVVSAGNDLQLNLATVDAASGVPLASRSLPVAGTYSDLAIGPSGEIAVVGGLSMLLPGHAYQLAVFDSSLATTLLSTALPAGQSARRVLMDAQRNLYITGAAIDPDSSAFTWPNGVTTSGPFSDWLTMKLDPAGTPLWTARLSQRTDIHEVPSVLALAADGAVLVAGSAGLAGSATPATQAQVVRYSATGALLWQGAAPTTQQGVGLAEAGDGGLFLVGARPRGVLSHFAGLPRPTTLTLASSSVTGGTRVTATLRLSGPAGTTVSLSSSRPAVASVPASLTVPAGATSASFTVTTYRVKTSTPVTLTATANGGTALGTLTVRR